VASGLDGYRNVATDGVDSVLVEPGDVDALAAALRRVLSDDGLRRSLIAAGGPRADQFSMHRLAELYAAHYERIAADREVRRRMLDDARERRRVSRMLARALGRP
jgi:glycosyltransferase involved in cell wall biosynthesis